MPYATSRDVRIYYEEGGRGPTVVAIPGLGGDLTTFDRLLNPLRAHLRVIGVDNRGAGRSDRPAGPYSISMFADDVLAVLDDAGVEKAAVLGMSMGGRTAIEFALAHPDRVSHLVLLSTAARAEQNWRRRLMAVLARLPLFKGPYPQPYSAYLSQYAASSVYDASDRLSEIRVPTLIMHGWHDGIVPPRLAAETHVRLPGSQLVWLDGGHVSPVLHPRRTVVDAITRFLTAPREEPPAPSPEG